MNIRTDLRNDFTGGQIAYFVKCAIEGFARGCVPSAGAWQLPPLYSGGVQFQKEPQHGSGNEEFALPCDVHRRGWGDCDDLVIARLVELALHGVDASCNAEWVGDACHVRVRYNDGVPQPDGSIGTLEDPAIICGATP